MIRPPGNTDNSFLFIHFRESLKSAGRGAHFARPTGVTGGNLRRTALVVEVDDVHARLCSMVLENEGFDVQTARTAEEGFDLVERYRPSIVVLDLILPKMSGLLFVQQLKAAKATRDIIVVAMNDMHDAAVERIALQAGCAAYIRKPIDRHALVLTLAAQARTGQEKSA